MRRRAFGGRRDLRDGLGRGFFQAGQRTLEGDGKNLVHGFDKVQLHGVAEILRHFRDIFFVVFRQNGFEKAGAMGRQQLFFQATNRQNLAPQRDFPGHGQIAANRNLAQGAGDGSRDRNAG